MDKLLPCPFCGQVQDEDTPEIKYLGYGPPPGYAYACGYCGAEGPMGTGKERDDHLGGKKAAADKWNRRAETPKADPEQSPKGSPGGLPEGVPTLELCPRCKRHAYMRPEGFCSSCVYHMIKGAPKAQEGEAGAAVPAREALDSRVTVESVDDHGAKVFVLHVFQDGNQIFQGATTIPGVAESLAALLGAGGDRGVGGGG